MKNGACAIVTLLGVLLFSQCSVITAERVLVVEELIPADADFYMDADLSDEAVALLKSNGVFRILADPDVQAAIKKMEKKKMRREPRKKMNGGAEGKKREERKSFREMLRDDLGLDIFDLEAMLGGRVAMGVKLGDKDEEGEWEVEWGLLVFDPGARKDVLRKNIATIIQTRVTSKKAKVTQKIYKDVEYTVLVEEDDGEDEPKCIGLLPNGWGIISTGETAFQGAVDRFRSVAVPSLAGEPGFQMLREKMAGSKSFLFQSANVLARSLEETDEDSREVVEQVIELLGLDMAQPRGIAMFLDGQVMKVRAYIPLASDATPISKLLREVTFPTKGLAAVPAGAMMVFGVRVVPERLWDTIVDTATKANERALEYIEEGIAEFEKMTGVSFRGSVLPSLDGDLVLAFHTKEGEKVRLGRMKGVLLRGFVTLNSREFMDSIIETLSQEAGRAPEMEVYNGFTVIKEGPRVAYSEDYLIICGDIFGEGDDEQILLPVDTAVGGVPGMVADKDFKEATAAFSRTPNGLFYINVPALCVALKKDAEREMRPILPLIGKRLTFVAFTRLDDPDGLLLEMVLK